MEYIIPFNHTFKNIPVVVCSIRTGTQDAMGIPVTTVNQISNTNFTAKAANIGTTDRYPGYLDWIAIDLI